MGDGIETGGQRDRKQQNDDELQTADGEHLVPSVDDPGEGAARCFRNVGETLRRALSGDQEISVREVFETIDRNFLAQGMRPKQNARAI
jgi:hypothetical protein